jgi:hypothetical protein
MVWVLWGTLGLCVVLVKYYTALGGRRLERRLNKVKADLAQVRQSLKDQREKEATSIQTEETSALRLRYMKEMIEDIKGRMTTSDRNADRTDQEGPIILPTFMRY